MLFKNVLRTLKGKSVQLFLIGIIMLLSSFLFTSIFYAIGGLEEVTNEYFMEYNQEDFSIEVSDYLLPIDITYLEEHCNLNKDYLLIRNIYEESETCYYGLLENRISVFEEEYEGIELELREWKDVYADVYDESHKYRIVKDADSINKSFIIHGHKPVLDDEIALSETYSKANGLTIGDVIVINEIEYTLVGHVLVPDYTFTMINNDLIIDNSAQSVGLMSDDAFEQLESTKQYNFAGDYQDYDADSFKKNVSDTVGDISELSFVYSIVLTKNNMRSGAIYAELSGGKAQAINLSVFIAGIAIMIVAIMVYKIIQNQHGQIGILKAMGYKNSQITWPYIFMISILALPTLVLGYFLGLLGSEPIKQIYLDFYMLPSTAVSQQVVIIFVAVFLPLLVLAGVSFFVILRLLKREPLELLNPKNSSGENKFVQKIARLLSKCNVKTKYQYLSVMRNVVRFIVYIVGVSFACILFLLGLSIVGLFSKSTLGYYESTNHEYIGYCNLDGCNALEGNQEGVIELNNIYLSSDVVSLIGLNSDSVIHPLYNEDDSIITSNLEYGLIITKGVQLEYGYDIGDEVDIEIGEKSITIEIVDVSSEYTPNKVYMSRSNLSVFLTDEDGYYNTIYSIEELDEDNFLYVLVIEELLAQIESSSEMMNTMILLIEIISIMISFIVIYILIEMAIEDNYYHISLLKVMGYNNKEINKMVINGYLLYSLIALVFAIFINVVIYKFLVVWMAQNYGVIMPVSMEFWHVISGVLMIVVTFYISAYIGQKKIKNISLQETLKMYQE